MNRTRQKSNQSGPPKVFISYSWDDERHIKWVDMLALKLRKDGVDVSIDQRKLTGGDYLASFMEQIPRNDFILMICTPSYKTRFDDRKGGVGYEANIISARMLYGDNARKYIPILRSAEWLEAAPTCVLGKYYFDFRGNPYAEKQYRDLLGAIYGIGKMPDIRTQDVDVKRLELLNDLEPE